MSAVYGMYYDDGRPADPQTAAAMLDGFRQYHSDDSGVWRSGEVFLGCYAQHITPESVHEQLPYHDNQADLVITADAIIDNRQELFDHLAIPGGQRRGMPDSQLILAAYKKWGTDCPRHLIGDLAFAIWDDRRKNLFCAVDATGTRTLYYCRKPGMFAFSTLMKPLLVLPGMTPKFNDTWITDFLAMPSVMHQLDPEITLYEGIYLLPAGHLLTFGPGGAAKEVYWQVTRQPELRLSADAEYVEAFQEIFAEAVRCRLRSRRPVAVMMSGGLDSTSVACVAARELAQTGQRLPVFSALPMKGYQDWLQPTRVADESAYIEAVRQHAGNIDVTYCRSEKSHSLSDTTRLFAMLEQPYKIFENLFWIESILAGAQDRGIGVMLSGDGGNATVSWGANRPYYLSLMKDGKWPLLLREARAIAKRRRLSLGRVLAGLTVACMPYDVQKAVAYLRYGREYDCRELSPINPSYARDVQVADRFRRFGLDPLFIRMGDPFSERRQMLDAATFSHIGPFLTKQSLAYSIAQRDPTMDKRVVEFCLSLPEDQYVRGGEERRFIRRAMAGIVPDKVLLNETIRGKQSADWLQRLSPVWQEVIAEIKAIGNQGAARHYLDVGRICRTIAKIDEPTKVTPDSDSVRMLLRAIIFCRFLQFENIWTEEVH